MIDVPLNEIRIILSLAMLSIATASDIKNREISDIIWIVFGAIGAILVAFSADIGEEMLNVGISLIVAPIVLIIWRVGLFGGADAFALIALAVLAPNMTMFEGTITPFTALTNAVVLSIAPMLVNVTRNTILIASGRKIFDGFEETTSRKIAAMFIGYRAANPKFGFSIERSRGKQKKLNLSLQHAENTAFCDRKDTWITPGVPYMIFITAGFVLQLIYGDILFSVFKIF
ncbi:A24 family peptidase C-terminal domain-containing protein [Candidatus Nitrosotenuis cloacae]|uniref:A24 family peptidase C-terminal domain-containing protein n=1 Tax=Candidatus Nitrosotenuis cloacae TaxID=1603555 RepID=UPI00227F2CBC|nr:A24 family peptidase C-terminal domain-containing protein [Candidatus Nitrosotenuis cloacae]